MGVISDAIDALEDWCCDLFKDGIKSQFDGISDLLTDTFSQTMGTGGSGGLVNDFVTQHPSQFTGGGTGGTTIWSTIETLCNNVVVPIGGFILTVILLNELIQMVLRGNNFKDFDDSIFIKWIIKALCGVILVANTYYIASALFSFGTTVCSNGLATLFGTGDYLSSTLSINPSALSGLSLGELMTVWFISLIVHLGVLILIVAIVITLASRIIEVFMYLSIAPIPMAMNRRRLQTYKQTKRELKFERKQLKTESKFRVKEFRNQKKISKLTRPGLLALKPVSYSAGRMKASAWQKAVNEDQDNDFLHAIDSAKRRVVEPAAQKVSKPQRLQKKEKQRDRLNDKKSKSNNRLSRQESKLKDKHDSYKKRKKPKPKKKKGVKDTLSAALKAAWKFVKNIYESEVKKFFGAIAVPIIIILLVFAFIIMIFSSITSGGGFTLGTYAAQDYDLSEAEKYYTELAYNLNRKIRMVSSDIDWQDGLAAFGADRNNIEDKPDEWRWGKSDVYDWEPQYDFNCYKLWAFLCAYNYDFDADNDDIYYWEFDGDMEDLLDDIFKEEYEFVYTYDNQSRWEYRNSFESKGYYSIESSGVSGDHGYIVISYPDALPFSGYCNDDTIYFDLSNGEVLNYNKSYAATGWYLKDQFKNDTDPDGNTYKGYYQNGETCGYGIYEDGKLTIPIPYVIPEKNWCSFLKKYDWKTDCRLYYNVKQNKTFDEVIADKLSSMSHSDERLQYYALLVGAEDSATMYGNHHTLHNLLPGATVRDYDLKREFGYEMTGWNTDSDGLYQGIKVYCTNGDKLKAPFKGKITDVNTDENKITVRKDDVEYWYDGTGGTERDTEVTIANAVLLSGFSEGDTVNDGQEFAKTTAGNVNFHIYIDTDGYGWDYIDPRLVLY